MEFSTSVVAKGAGGVLEKPESDVHRFYIFISLHKFDKTEKHFQQQKRFRRRITVLLL